MADECGHNAAVYGWTGDSWSKACPPCGLKTSGSQPSAEEADREWRRISRPRLDAKAVEELVASVLLKQSLGEALTEREEVILAYGHHAPACHHEH